jgi:hypothetical protein
MSAPGWVINEGEERKKKQENNVKQQNATKDPIQRKAGSQYGVDSLAIIEWP